MGRPGILLLLLLLLLLPLLGGLLLPLPGSGAGRSARVTLDPVRREPLARTTPILGRLVARQSGPVAARIDDRVATVRVAVGDRVAAGALLARLDDDRLRQEKRLRVFEKKEAEARLKSRQAALDLVVLEQTRMRRLRASAAFNQSRDADLAVERLQAEGAVAEARAALQTATTRLALAEIALQDAEITAPYPGVVTRRHVASGAYVRAGAPVVTLVNDHSLEAEADVPSSALSGLAPGTVLRLVFASGEQRHGAVRTIVPEENPRTRTRPLRISLDLPQEGETGLALNQSVTVHVPVAGADPVLTVHKDALLTRNGRSVVFVATGEDRAALRTITVGRAAGTRLEVRTGLEEGEPVVIRGNERLRPGQAIVTAPGS